MRCAARHDTQLHRVRRALAAAALRDGRRRVRAGGHTPTRSSACARSCAKAIAAGAAGFSTSFSYAHRGVDGKPVPSRFSEADEVEALFLAAGEAGKGVVLITPGTQCTYADVYEWQPRVGRPFTYPMFASPGGKHLEPLALHEAGARSRRAGVAAGHAAAPDDAVHDGRPVQPQHGQGVR